MAALTATASEIMEAVKLLNDNGRWITLQQCLAMAKYEMYQNKETETTWTGYFRGVKTEGNIVFPEWG
jgi:hypothetical protein